MDAADDLMMRSRKGPLRSGLMFGLGEVSSSRLHPRVAIQVSGQG